MWDASIKLNYPYLSVTFSKRTKITLYWWPSHGPHSLGNISCWSMSKKASKVLLDQFASAESYCIAHKCSLHSNNASHACIWTPGHKSSILLLAISQNRSIQLINQISLFQGNSLPVLVVYYPFIKLPSKTAEVEFSPRETWHSYKALADNNLHKNSGGKYKLLPRK